MWKSCTELSHRQGEEKQVEYSLKIFHPHTAVDKEFGKVMAISGR